LFPLSAFYFLLYNSPHATQSEQTETPKSIRRRTLCGWKTAMTLASAFPASPEAPLRRRSSKGLSRSDWLIVWTLILLWGYAIYRLGTLWSSNKDYAFGWFVPLLSLALLWERWTWQPERDASTPADGTLVLMGGCALSLAIGAVLLEVMPVWRFAGWLFALPVIVLTLVGLYFLGGRSWSRHFAFPILFFLVAVPWPTRFEQPLISTLSHLNTFISVALSNLLGVVAVQHGTLIETGGGFVGVDDACSGIRSFQSSITVALFLGELFRYGVARRLLLLFSAVLFAFTCNVVRTTYLVCVCDLKGLEAVNLRHDQAGFTILGVTLVGLLFVAWLLRPRKSRGKSSTVQVGKQVQGNGLPLSTELGGCGPIHPVAAPIANLLAYIKPALVGLVIWVVLVETGIEAWFLPNESHAASGINWTFNVPSNPAFSENKISDNVRAMLDYDEGKSAQWQDIAGHPWKMFYFRWLPASSRYRATVSSAQAYGHAPDICLRNAGMILETNFGAKIVDFNGVSMRVYIEKFLDGGRYFYVATCNWEPVVKQLENKPSGEPSTSMGFKLATHALENHDRNRLEKRVIKVGVWDMETDDEAKAALHDLILNSIKKG
jgi:exosortase